jgi:glycine/D-amino acid oxidase-like deaminating enzyme
MACDGAFMLTALSGFGSMAACAAGRLCAAYIGDGELPAYAKHLSMQRYEDRVLMRELETAESKGIV